MNTTGLALRFNAGYKIGYMERFAREAYKMIKVGIGYDAHTLVPGRKLILGGVEIPYEYGLLGHSDADVLTHAIIDALIGACGLGSIGEMFPNTDPAYKNISSIDLLIAAHARFKHEYRINNIDATIVAQEPKLTPHIYKMRHVLGKALDLDRINIKATTTEFMGFEGRGEGISAMAVCILEKKAGSLSKRGIMMSNEPKTL
jgi:2-C-methyl-D-erythritol 2,4-cyclodiphosphate synthase